MQWPATADELLGEIERLIPERLPEPGETMEAFNQYVGARRLVLQLSHARTQASKERKPRRVSR